jgi:hypothetical protein
MGARDATSASTSVRLEARVSASRDGALPSDLLDASCSRRGDLRARGTRGEAPEPVHEDRAARVASSTRERAALEVKHRAASRGRPRRESGLEHEGRMQCTEWPCGARAPLPSDASSLLLMTRPSTPGRSEGRYEHPDPAVAPNAMLARLDVCHVRGAKLTVASHGSARRDVRLDVCAVGGASQRVP